MGAAWHLHRLHAKDGHLLWYVSRLCFAVFAESIPCERAYTSEKRREEKRREEKRRVEKGREENGTISFDQLLRHLRSKPPCSAATADI